MKQLKVVNQSGEDWHVSYQLDLPVEAQLAEVKNKLQQTDVDEWRKDPLLRASLYWGLRHGNQETRRRVIRALAVVRDDDAERALKLFLERKDVSGQVRLHALVALKQMGACGVVHVMEQGELKAVQLEDIADDIIFEMNANWRAVWDRAQAWFEEQGLRKLMVDAKRVWIAYLYELFLHAHRIGKPEIWAAGLIYVILRYFDIPVVQRELAEFFHVSASSIRKSSVRLEQVMLQTGL